MHAIVSLDPDDATALWTDTSRWPTFIEGFARVLELSADWPAEGAEVVWESIPQGRGRVTERVVDSRPGRFGTEVSEQRLQGRQTVAFGPSPAGEGTLVELGLEYELADQRPLSRLADLIFIRRALRDALRRTLTRFAVEAREDASLR